MPRAKENLKIEVTQSTDGDVRTIAVTITAPAKDFLLPDLLSDRGAVRPYEATLKEAVKAATEGYLAGTEELIATLVADQKPGQKVEEPKPKSKPNNGRKAKSVGSKREDALTGDSMISTLSEPARTGMAVSVAGD